jgi:hypothetical protein
MNMTLTLISWFRRQTLLVGGLAALFSIGGLSAQTGPVNFASGTITLTTGQASATTWQTQSFGKTFTAAPVVIMGPAHSADGEPHVLRVRSVTTTNFQWQIDEWDYLAGAHTGSITVSWYAMTDGVHVLGSQRWQVGRVTNANRGNLTVALSGFTDPPSVLAQVYTTANVIATDNPKALKSRVSAVTNANFTLNLETQESDATTLTNESVGFVAVSDGVGYLDGKVLWAYSPETVGHVLKTFYTGPFTNPAVIAQTQTKNDTNPGDLRLSTVPSLVNSQTRVQMTFQEEISANADVTHTPETVAGLFIGDMPGEAAAKLVFNNISISQPTATTWAKVNLGATYTAPVIVFGPLTYNNSPAAHIRVRNIIPADAANSGRTSFEYQIDEWDFNDGIHSTETMGYMVMEEGVFAIGGQVVQAKRVNGVTNTAQTVYVNDSYWASDIYYEREPVIFSQCVTTNEASAVAARVDSVDTLFDYPANFRLRLTEAENADQTHAAETVHCLIFTAGPGRFMSSNGNLPFCAGVSNSLSSTNSAVTFPTRYATPVMFAGAMGDEANTIPVDGHFNTNIASDLDPINIRRIASNAAGMTWLAQEDSSTTPVNNTHNVEVGGWLVLQKEVDTDLDGISDADENRMGTDINNATSTANASGGVANDWDTWVALQSITLTVTQANIYEVLDRGVTPQQLQKGVVQLTRTGTMPLTVRVSSHNGTSAVGKGNASVDDFTTAVQPASPQRATLSMTGATGTMVIHANQGSATTPVILEHTPILDNVMEVPESLRITVGNIPAGTNPQVIARHSYYTLRDAVGTNTNNRTLYVAYLTKAPGVSSTASGIATALLEGDNAIARVNVDASGLGSGYVNTYLRTDPGGVDLRNNLSATAPPFSNVQWDLVAAGTYTTDQGLLDGLNSGGVRCDIGTAVYGAGEIRGVFNRTTGYAVFDAGRPDLIAPTLPGSLTLVQANRDIHRFLDQSTFGSTSELYAAIKAKVDALDPLDPNPAITGEPGEGCTSANLIAGYTAWLNDQINATTTPNPNFLTLVMSADNEEFLMRGSKPLWAGNDQQFAGAGYTASYDAYGNVTNPYATASNNAYAFNAPQNSANRRREWWTMVLQAKAQLRQRMALALSEVLVISEADTNVNNRHYGAARYWDMLADGAFGKYRDLLEDVSYSPMMGIYLSHLRNRAQYTSGGVDIFPDENYAREIMQLFSIGLVMRHPDGALVLNNNGLPIATYDQTDITELARVMTGLCHGARHASVPVTRNSANGYQLITANMSVGQVEFQTVNYTDFSSGAGEAFYQAPWLYPMKALGRYNGITYHDFGAKVLFNAKAGQTAVPAQSLTGLTDFQTNALADTDLRIAHNALAGDPAGASYNGHPNTPQFISRILIQRLVTSNPTPGYVYRVSQKWRTTNGNLGEVLKAILLDYEARSLTVADDDIYAGKMKEPLVQFASFVRAFKPYTGARLDTLTNMSTGFSGSDSPMLGSYPAGELSKFAPANPTRLRFADTTGFIGQSPQRAPSVFNWFLPDYIQPGLMAEQGLFGPELQINTESLLVNRVNRHYSIALMGITGGTPGFAMDDFTTNSANMATQLLTSTQTLTFNSTNWNVPQSVFVYGLENTLDDGTRASSILHQVASGDPNFSNTYTPPINFTLNDNDSLSAKLVAITQTSGSTAVTEGGATDTYKVVLTAAPTANVVITPSAVQPWQVATAVASTDVTISPATLTFTTANWNTAQTVTVTAVNNALADSFLEATPTQIPGSNPAQYRRVAVIRHSVSSSDIDYNGSLVSDFNCSITEDEAATARRFRPVKATATGIPVVTEGSTTDTYAISFATGTPPTADVTVTLGYDAARVSLSATGLTVTGTGTATMIFTSANYATARTVTITAVNDSIFQGPAFSTITHTTTSTGDATYNALPCAPVRVRVNDNDDAATNGVLVLHTWAATQTVENGMTDTYLVALRKAPTGNVTLTWSGNDGDVSGIGNLAFTTANWSIPQTVTVTARNDLRVERTTQSAVKYTPSGGGYVAADAHTLLVGVGDDDLNSAAGILVTQTGGSTTATEGGSTDTYSVRLAGSPNNDVVITQTTNSQLTLSVPVLTFTPINWNTAQNVTVTAVNDTVAEGTHSAAISSTVASTDARYNNFPVADQSVIITDNDNGPRIVVTETSGTSVTEGGANDTFTVNFTGGAAPSGSVVVNVAGTAQASVSPTSLTFTTTNYATPQTVTVSAANDATSEPPVVEVITLTTDAAQPATYNNLSASVNVSVNDNDAQNNNGAISIIQTNGATRVVEGGMTDTIEVVLRRAPTANVVLTSSYSVASQIATNATTYTFTPSNWNVPQTVTITATNDTTVEGAHAVTLTFTANNAGGYVTADTATQVVTISDNEAGQPMINATLSVASLTEGSNGTLTLSLGAIPNAGATVNVRPTAYLLNATSGQVTFSPTSVSFTTADWNTPKNITVTAANDTLAEPTHNLAITTFTTVTAGADTRYGGPTTNDIGQSASDFALSVIDNDSAAARIDVAHTSGSTVLTEDAGTDTVTVAFVAPSAPTSDVTVNLARSGSQYQFLVNGSLATSAALTFTSANYATPQTVTLVVSADTSSEGVHADTLTASTTASAPGIYASLSTALPIRVLDSDDLARQLIGIVQSGPSTAVVEGGMTDTYTVVLRRAPSANVTVSANFNPGQLTVSPVDLTFTAANWNVPQTVTVTATDDFELENVHSSTIRHIAGSTGGYLPSDFIDVAVSIGDNESVGSSRITATESGGYTWLVESTTLTATDNYTLVLGTAPSANVTITPQVNNNVGGTNAVTFSPPTVTFTPANWSTAQTVTINLAPNTTNNVAARPAVFIGHVVSSTDQNYRSALTPNINAIISDASDTFSAATAPGIAVVATNGTTSVFEGATGNTDTVYVFLKKQPTTGATVTVTPSLTTTTAPHTAITGQVTFTPATLSFTAANWNTPQILTITALPNTISEAPLSAALICTPSVGGGYAATNTNASLSTSPTGTPLGVTVYDDDQVGKLVISQPTTSLLEGGSTSYTVALNGPPAAGQTVTVTIVTQKHVVPPSSHALQYGYFSASATNSSMQKDNMLFDWQEVVDIYTAAYHADRAGAPESTSTSTAGHLAGSKAVIDRLDELWGGGRMKTKWPDGSSLPNDQRALISEAIQKCYSLNRLSTDTVNFPNEVLNRCRFAAHLVSVAPTAIISH